MSIVLIRQIPDDYADSTGLAKYNRSRMPGCKDIFQAGKNYDGTYVTGLTDELEESYKKTLRKDVSKVNEEFWESFRVEIHADKPKMFNTLVPLDNISLKMLIANKHVAPTKEDAYRPEYKDAQYYAYTEETENAEEISSRKKRDKAIGLLLIISENKDRMLLYGKYLEGLRYTDKLSTDTIYKMLRAYIEDKDIKNANRFIEVFQKPIEELQQKIIIDKAIKQRLIVKNGNGKKQIYQYGQVTLGTTIEDVYKNLMSPEFAPELIAISKDLK